MNKSFKVVFSKARSALMVVNEATSSIQAKGTKTVIAVAAAMVAGGAVAAQDFYVGKDAVVTWGSDGAETPAVKVSVDAGKVYSDVDLTKEVTTALADGDTFNLLTGGTVNVKADKGVLQTVTAKTLTGGTLVISSYDAAAASDKKNATVNYGGGATAVGAVTIEFAANTGSGAEKGVSSFVGDGTNALTLGSPADPDTGRGAAVTTLKTAAGAAGTVDASGQALNLTNVAFDNQGELTLTGTTVTFGTAYENQTGKLNVSGAAVFNDAYTSTNVVIGDAKNVSGAKDVFDSTVTVGSSGSLTVDSLTINKASADANTNALTLSAGAVATIGTADITSGGISLTAGTDAKHQTSATITTLNLKGSDVALKIGGNAVVAGETINATGTNVVTSEGSLKYNAVNVTDAKAAASLMITNSGTAEFGTVTVTATDKGAATLTLASGQAPASTSGMTSAGAVVLTGYSKDQTASFTVEGTDPGTDSKTQKQKYNLTADSILVNKHASATLNAAQVLVNGDLTVNADGSLTTAAGNTTTVNKTLTLASGSTAQISGSMTVGALVNDTMIAPAQDKTLKVTGIDGVSSVNSGIISGAGNVAVKGNFDNKIYVDAASKLSAVNLAAGTLTVADGVFNNAGIVEVTTLTLDKGAVYNTAYLAEVPATKKADTTYTKATDVNVAEGAVFNIADLNAKSSGATANDLLKIVSAIHLNGGSLQVKGASTETVDVVLSGQSGALTVGADANTGVASAQTFKSVTAESSGSLTINGGAAVTVTGTLETASSGTVTVTDGTLNVTDAGAKVYTEAAGDLTVDTNGVFTTTNSALNLKIDSTGALKNEVTKISDTVSKQFNGLANKGEVVVTGLTGEAKDVASLTGSVQSLFGMTVGKQNSGALVDLGAVKVKGLTATNGAYAAKDVEALSGIVLDIFKNATINGIASENLNGVYGKLVMAAETTANFAAGAKTVVTGTGNLVENKKGELQGVTIASGKNFTYRGAEGATGAVKSVEFTDAGFLNVEGGTLEVMGDITDAATPAGAIDVAAATGLVVNGDLTVANMDVDGAVTVKNHTDATTGEVTPGITTVGTKFMVGETGTFTTAGKTTLKAGGDVLGTATFAELAVTGTLNVGDATHAGHATIGNLSSGTVAFDPDFDPKTQTLAVEKASTGVVNAADKAATTMALNGSIVGVGAGATEADAVKAFVATGFGLGQRNAKQADGTILNKDADLVTSVVVASTYNATTKKHETFEGKVYAGTDKNAAVNGVDFTKDTMLVIDAKNVDTTGITQVFGQQITFNSGAELELANIGNGDKIVLGQFKDDLSAEAVEDELQGAEFTGDVLMGVSLAKADTTTGLRAITVAMKDKAAVKDEFGDLPGIDAAYEMFKGKLNNGTSSSVAFNNWLYTGANHASVAAFQAAAKDVASLGATTGVQTMTMDAVNQMGETVADRVSLLTQRAAGVNVWAAANGGMFEAKSLFDGAGYESDIYSGVLGVDYQFACNAVLGAALTIGTADTDNKNSTVKASTDSDLVGFSVYTSKTFADVLGVSADIGYLTASNDVTANGYGQAWKFSQDTDAFTIGLRTEVLAEVGAVKLVPHIGIRYTALSTDGFEAGYKTEIDDQNVFQMPVGVTVSGDFQTGDWTVAPKFDLSVVPTFGDKDADLKLGITGVNATDDLAVRVIDSNPVQATLGVNATNGAWGFGLNYKLGVGSDDRMNNTFNVNVRYAF